MAIMLTNHQRIKQQDVLTSLQSGKKTLLKGSAGVGKTWLLKSILTCLVPRLKDREIIYCTAPTHNAVGVIQEKVGRMTNVEFKTIHSALKLKKNIDYKTGEISFKPSFDAKYPPLKNVAYIIIDEGSMLPEQVLKILFEHAKIQNTKILFCGDAKQLPPVGEEISNIFTNDDVNVVELTEIIRQGEGSPIIDVSMNIDLIRTKESKQLEDGSGYIFSNDRDKVISTLAYVNGSKDLKCVAYTNKEVNSINMDVRKYIYGNPAKVELGESIIFNAPYGENYVNNEEIKVESISIKTLPFSFIAKKSYNANVPDTIESIDLKVYCINNSFVKTTTDNDNWIGGEETTKEIDNIYILHEDSEEDYDRCVKYLRSLCKLADTTWVEFYRFTEQFADINYSHALTVHKSQGNTYKQVIVNVGNIMMNKDVAEREKMLYTAITRASDLVIFYNI